MPEGSEPELSPRASDAERNQTVDQLRTAFVEGRLNDDEFDQRMRAALTARTHADLNRLLTDLPQATVVAAPATATPSPLIGGTAPGAPATHWAVAVMSGTRRHGRWKAPPAINAVAIMGGCELDFRAATFSSQTTTVTVACIMGGVEITVPPGIRVEWHGFALMGGMEDRVDETDLPAGAPVLIVRGFVMMGGVEIQTKAPKDKDNGQRRALP
ncbi:MAG TPA: DUF1707 domain-containing protein [Actinomycetota bacterium]